MSSEIAIQVNNLTKSYHIYDKPQDRLLQMLFRGKKQFFKEFSALKDVSFAVNRGDSIGILGRNGAGKSTLLQLLTGTLAPTSGEIKITGRVAALLELGAGFNPEFSGRENVYMNATILGLTKAQIDEKYEEILAFAGIGDFINRSVKTYSSGMYIRLAFAVAVHTDPDVLIIDEALSVGDIRFQMKCLRHMEQLKLKGTTIFFVSHAPEQVKRFCNKAIWLEAGAVKASGSSAEICDQYNDYMTLGDTSQSSDRRDQSDAGALPARLLSTALDRRMLNPGDSLNLTIEYEVFDAVVEGLLIGAAIYTPDRHYIFGPNTHLGKVNIPCEKGKHCVKYSIPSMPLLPGTFTFDVGIFSEKGLVNFDYITAAEEFQMFDEYRHEGLLYIEHEWTVLT